MGQLPEGTVTILFTDVEGSTDLSTSRGDEGAQEILRAQRDLARCQVEEHDGHEVKGTGDGLMVAFGSARKAVACAIGIQRAIDEYNRRQPPEQRARVRIGMNAGEVIREEEDLFGAAVNAAARIAAKADGDQILVSETVRALLGAAAGLQFADRGRFRLKGFPDRWRLFEVIWREEAPAAVAPVAAERTPYVGREAERAELRRFLDQTLAGRGALVMIGGEPGVGKTRLAEEIAEEARQRGMTERTGHCYEMEGAPPYIPFVEMLEQAARLTEPAALRAALGDSAAEVARIAPELRRLFPDIPPPLELPPEQERRYLFNSMREFVDRASRVNPLLLVLDDLHWADDSTLLLLEHVAQQLGQMPVLMVATYRDVELDVGRPLARTLEALLRQRLAHRIALRRLDEARVEAMLAALGGPGVPAPLVHAVFRETEGNPFFVEEVFQHLSEEGKLFDAQGHWRPDLNVSELDVPEGIRLVIGRRLERLGEEGRRVLAAAAVAGRNFDYEVLEALDEVDADALLDAIDLAERAQLITSLIEGSAAGQAVARFSFAHELIRQTLISGLSLPRRQRLHLRVAEAMERVYARALDDRVADVAHHLYQAGAAADPGKTARYLTLAGDRAYAAAAFEDGLRLYDDAVALQPPEDKKERSALRYKRGLARRSLGRWEEALQDWEDALSLCEQLGDAEAAGRVCHDMCWLEGWSNRPEEGAAVARRGLALLGDQPSADRCRLLADCGVQISLIGDFAGGDAMMDEALAIAHELGDEHLLGRVLASKCGHHWNCMQVREAMETGRSAMEFLRPTGDVWSLADAAWVTQLALDLLGRLEEAAEIGREIEPLAGSLGHLGALMAAGRAQSIADLALTGSIGDYERMGRSDLELCESAGMPWISHSHSMVGLAHFWSGRLEEALAEFQEAFRLEPGGAWAGGDRGFLFLALAYAGERDRALALLDDSAGILPRGGQVNGIGAWGLLCCAVEGLVVLGERDRASALYPVLSDQFDTGVVIILFGKNLLQTVAGIAAAAGRQWEAAQEHYETALRQAHDVPHRLEQPEVRRWYARMLIDRDEPGDRDKARELLTEAVAMYRDMEMPMHLEMAEALLAEA